jgi:hypothetical protein
MIAESSTWEAERCELQAVLSSPLFSRSPTLTHLLTYLCEKTFAGETDQIKEYSVALDVFDRRDSFDQDTDSIVRVQANRLRKRLAEYYAHDGVNHPIQITIPVGQYVPQFKRVALDEAQPLGDITSGVTARSLWLQPPRGLWLLAAFVLIGLTVAAFLSRPRSKPQPTVATHSQLPMEENIGLPVGDEVHILAGATRKYVDHAGKLWTPDAYFSGGTAVVSTVQHIWRTQDPIVYRNSRQGDFAYNIPLKPGAYELHLHFAEMFFGPENPGGGGEGNRTMNVSANGQPILRDFDVLADAGGGRTAEVKVFPDLSPAPDGQIHLNFEGENGNAMVSAIEILPGIHSHLRPVRIVARDVPYYSNDSRWWSPDAYFKGGQLSTSQESALGTDDPEFYETERWGHFSYAIPVAPGKYTVTMHFIEHGDGPASASTPTPSTDGVAAPLPSRVFNVFCNGRTILANLNVLDLAGQNRPLVRKVKGLTPNAQGKLLLEFVPVTRYAIVTAIEVIQE